MGRSFYIKNIPGTTLDSEKTNGLTGMNFLDSVFMFTNGIMLNQIRDITGIDGSTLQNWTKRGWVTRPDGKYYKKEHLARILLINMMCDTMMFSDIINVLIYINGDLESTDDDIITDSMLYEYVCQVISIISQSDSHGIHEAETAVDKVIENYVEVFESSKERLKKGLMIIVTAYYASIVKAAADRMISELPAAAQK